MAFEIEEMKRIDPEEPLGVFFQNLIEEAGKHASMITLRLVSEGKSELVNYALIPMDDETAKDFKSTHMSTRH